MPSEKAEQTLAELGRRWKIWHSTSREGIPSRCVLCGGITWADDCPVPLLDTLKGRS